MMWTTFITLVITVQAAYASSYADHMIHFGTDCPCSDPKYCERITAADRQEIFGYGVNLTYYKQFDWEKLTSIVIYESWLTKYGMDLVCLAHKHDTRVLIATVISSEQLTNATARSQIVKYYFDLAEKYFMDGANIDVEIQTKTPEVRNGLTDYVEETKTVWKAAYPHSLVVTDVWWIPNIYHDTVALANYSDFLFIMSYDEKNDMLKPCVGKANAPYAQTQFGVAAFRVLGIPGHKLVVGLPWYGYVYECLKFTENNLCYLNESGGHCTVGIGTQIDYSTILQILPHSMGGRQWSNVYESPFANFKDSAGTIHQIWYDDTESLKLKYALAEKYNLRGVGIWHTDALNYANASDPTTGDMWDALPTYK